MEVSVADAMLWVQLSQAAGQGLEGRTFNYTVNLYSSSDPDTPLLLLRYTQDTIATVLGEEDSLLFSWGPCPSTLLQYSVGAAGERSTIPVSLPTLEGTWHLDTFLDIADGSEAVELSCDCLLGAGQTDLQESVVYSDTLAATGLFYTFAASNEEKYLTVKLACAEDVGIGTWLDGLYWSSTSCPLPLAGTANQTFISGTYVSGSSADFYLGSVTSASYLLLDVSEASVLSDSSFSFNITWNLLDVHDDDDQDASTGKSSHTHDQLIFVILLLACAAAVVFVIGLTVVYLYIRGRAIKEMATGPLPPEAAPILGSQGSAFLVQTASK